MFRYALIIVLNILIWLIVVLLGAVWLFVVHQSTKLLDSLLMVAKLTECSCKRVKFHSRDLIMRSWLLCTGWIREETFNSSMSIRYLVHFQKNKIKNTYLTWSYSLSLSCVALHNSFLTFYHTFFLIWLFLLLFILDISCVEGLCLWRNSSSMVNYELYKGYQAGNSWRAINEIVAGLFIRSLIQLFTMLFISIVEKLKCLIY